VVEGRARLVEDRPEARERLLVAPVADRVDSSGEVGGGEERAAVGGEEGAFRRGRHPLQLGLVAAQRRGERGEGFGVARAV
jgi:hypothetical protein